MDEMKMNSALKRSGAEQSLRSDPQPRHGMLFIVKYPKKTPVQSSPKEHGKQYKFCIVLFWPVSGLTDLFLSPSQTPKAFSG